MPLHNAEKNLKISLEGEHKTMLEDLRVKMLKGKVKGKKRDNWKKNTNKVPSRQLAYKRNRL